MVGWSALDPASCEGTTMDPLLKFSRVVSFSAGFLLLPTFLFFFSKSGGVLSLVCLFLGIESESVRVIDKEAQVADLVHVGDW